MDPIASTRAVARAVAAQQPRFPRAPDGDLLLLTGPSGCGKTTILHYLAGSTLRVGADGDVDVTEAADGVHNVRSGVHGAPVQWGRVPGAVVAVVSLPYADGARESICAAGLVLEDAMTRSAGVRIALVLGEDERGMIDCIRAYSKMFARAVGAALRGTVLIVCEDVDIKHARKAAKKLLKDEGAAGTPLMHVCDDVLRRVQNDDVVPVNFADRDAVAGQVAAVFAAEAFQGSIALPPPAAIPTSIGPYLGFGKVETASKLRDAVCGIADLVRGAASVQRVARAMETEARDYLAKEEAQCCASLRRDPSGATDAVHRLLRLRSIIVPIHCGGPRIEDVVRELWNGDQALPGYVRRLGEIAHACDLDDEYEAALAASERRLRRHRRAIARIADVASPDAAAVDQAACLLDSAETEQDLCQLGREVNDALRHQLRYQPAATAAGSRLALFARCEDALGNHLADDVATDMRGYKARLATDLQQGIEWLRGHAALPPSLGSHESAESLLSLAEAVGEGKRVMDIFDALSRRHVGLRDRLLDAFHERAPHKVPARGEILQAQREYGAGSVLDTARSPLDAMLQQLAPPHDVTLMLAALDVCDAMAWGDDDVPALEAVQVLVARHRQMLEVLPSVSNMAAAIEAVRYVAGWDDPAARALRDALYAVAGAPMVKHVREIVEAALAESAPPPIPSPAVVDMARQILTSCDEVRARIRNEIALLAQQLCGEAWRDGRHTAEIFQAAERLVQRLPDAVEGTALADMAEEWGARVTSHPTPPDLTETDLLAFGGLAASGYFQYRQSLGLSDARRSRLDASVCNAACNAWASNPPPAALHALRENLVDLPDDFYDSSCRVAHLRSDVDVAIQRSRRRDAGDAASVIRLFTSAADLPSADLDDWAAFAALHRTRQVPRAAWGDFCAALKSLAVAGSAAASISAARRTLEAARRHELVSEDILQDMDRRDQDACCTALDDENDTSTSAENFLRRAPPAVREAVLAKCEAECTRVAAASLFCDHRYRRRLALLHICNRPCVNGSVKDAVTSWVARVLPGGTLDLRPLAAGLDAAGRYVDGLAQMHCDPWPEVRMVCTWLLEQAGLAQAVLRVADRLHDCLVAEREQFREAMQNGEYVAARTLLDTPSPLQRAFAAFAARYPPELPEAMSNLLPPRGALDNLAALFHDRPARFQLQFHAWLGDVAKPDTTVADLGSLAHRFISAADEVPDFDAVCPPHDVAAAFEAAYRRLSEAQVVLPADLLARLARLGVSLSTEGRAVQHSAPSAAPNRPVLAIPGGSAMLNVLQGIRDLCRGAWMAAVRQFDAARSPDGPVGNEAPALAAQPLLAVALCAGEYWEEARKVLGPAHAGTVLDNVAWAIVAQDAARVARVLEGCEVAEDEASQAFGQYAKAVARGRRAGYSFRDEWNALIRTFHPPPSEVSSTPPAPPALSEFTFNAVCVGAAPSLLELSRLVGLRQVKERVQGIVATALNQAKTGARSPAALVRPLVFVGNPGTGKTTVASIVANVLGELGLVQKKVKVKDKRNPQSLPARMPWSVLGSNPSAPRKSLDSDPAFQNDVQTLIADLRRQPRPAPLQVDRRTPSVGKYAGQYATQHPSPPNDPTTVQARARDLEEYLNLMGAFTPGESLYNELYRNMVLVLKLHGLADGEDVDFLFTKTTAADLKRDGAQAFADLIEEHKDGGCIFIDETYQLMDQKTGRGDGQAIMDKLLTAMEDCEDMFFILGGYRKEMEELLDTNPGFASRIGETIAFEDYTEAELRTIFFRVLNRELPQSRVDNEMTVDIAIRRLAAKAGKPSFGNARSVRNLVEGANARLQRRLPPDATESECRLLTRADVLGGLPLRIDDPTVLKLDAMMGLVEVKKAIIAIAKTAVQNLQLEAEGSTNVVRRAQHRLFLGNPGTGKTEVAVLYGQLLCKMGLVDSDEVVKRTPQDLRGAVIGEAEKVTAALLKRCEGKVLFIDEAYALGDADPFSKAVVDTLVGNTNGTADDGLVLIMAGYDNDMERMLRDVNAGLRGRMQADSPFRFEDFSKEDLSRIVRREVDVCSDVARIDRVTVDHAVDVLEKQKHKKNFRNYAAVKSLVGAALEKAASRRQLATAVTLVPDDFPMHAGAQQATELSMDDFPPLARYFATSQLAIERLKRKGKDPRRFQETLCFIFTGSPGTGKTTAARLLGECLQKLGILGDGRVVEKSKSALETGYVGQAGRQTQEMLREALGGVLFIDEAYRLSDGGRGYGTEIIDELCDAVTKDEFRGKVAVVLAGYDVEMKQMLEKNPGMPSRFQKTLSFPDITPERCEAIFRRVANEQYGEEVVVASETLQARFKDLIARTHQWANARDVKNLANECFQRQQASPQPDGWSLPLIEAAAASFLAARTKPQVDAPRNAVAAGVFLNPTTSGTPPPTAAAVAAVAVSDPPESPENDAMVAEPPAAPSAFWATFESIVQRMGVSGDDLVRQIDAGKLDPAVRQELESEGYTETDVAAELASRRRQKQAQQLECKRRGIRTITYCTVCLRANCNFRPVTEEVEVDL